MWKREDETAACGGGRGEARVEIGSGVEKAE